MTANPIPNAINVVVTVCQPTWNDLIVSFQIVNLLLAVTVNQAPPEPVS
jgi:hypothetical protein